MGSITDIAGVLFFDADEEEMTKRIMERAKTSGRVDDNMESLKKRFVTFREDTMPVIADYEGKNKVIKVDAMGTLDEVSERVDQAIKQFI